MLFQVHTPNGDKVCEPTTSLDHALEIANVADECSEGYCPLRIHPQPGDSTQVVAENAARYLHVLKDGVEESHELLDMFIASEYRACVGVLVGMGMADYEAAILISDCFAAI